MGNEFRQYYTVSEAIAYFRGQGYRVESREVERFACSESWMTRVWQVQNPGTGEWMDVNTCYREVRAIGDDKAWQAHVSKLDLISYFNNKKRNEQR